MPLENLWNGIVMENPAEQFRLGTDSMVLADFVHPAPGSRVVDLGCGTGAISLMLLASDPTLQVTGLELQEPLLRSARQNKERNRLEQLSLLLGDLRKIRELFPAGGFQWVVSNPPYFPANVPASADPLLAAARSEQTCSPEELCAAAAWLLQTGGHFSAVHRPERLAVLLCAMRENRLEPKTLQFVRHSAATRRSLVLVDAVAGGKPGLDCRDDLALFAPDGSPTEDYLRIYHREE